MARQKSAWDKLSMRDRAQFIRLGLQHGLGNLKDIRDTYNLYSNGGDTQTSSKPNVKQSFNDWVKGVVYTGMSQRAGTDRDIVDAFKAVTQPNTNGIYSGSMGEDGWPNWDRNLINLYLNKDASSFEEISSDDLHYKGGHDYTEFLQQRNKNKDIKTYKGDLAIGLEPKVSPAIYQLAQDMGKQGVHTNRNMDLDMLLHYNDYGLNMDRGVNKDAWEYHMQPGEYVDDTRHFKRYYTNVNGKPIIQASKLWDFTPHDNMDNKEKIKSWLLTKYGTPFILRDAQELQQSNENTLDNRVYNTSILEDAINNKVVINNQDGTVSPLISLPEIEVTPSSSDWVFYSKDYEDSAYEKPILSDTAKGKVDSSNKKVVHTVFNSTPLVGHYITQEQLDSYPYTEYTTLYDEANGIQYNNGGHLGHWKDGTQKEENQDLNYPNLLPEVTVMPKWYDREWAKRSAAGLSALGTIATYIPHPYAKAAGLIAQVPDVYYDTRSLVSDVKNTDNWIDEGLNTLILDPFFRKKRPLIERLGKGADYLGPFKKINIPLSALDAVNDGYYAITGNKLSKDVQALVDNKKSTGGPLYPFSFEKNPFLKTPVVRYDDGGEITNINLPEFTIMPRDSFVTYTGEETIAPTQEEYIKSKQNEARVLAGHKMLNIEKPVMPIIPSQSLQSKAMGYLGMSDQERINRYGICLDPQTCIYTVTSMYPKENRVSGTETFADNSLNYGFIPVQNGVFGDIGLFDGHGTMITGFNNKRQPILSYSRGGLDASNILIDIDNWENSQGDHYLGGMGPMTSYRFIGTPSQQNKWIREYKSKYHKYE